MAEEELEDDPAAVEDWLTDQRSGILKYLQRQPDEFGQLGEVAAWHLYPHLSVWVVESTEYPDCIGHWVISGDVPTDYLHGDEIEGKSHPQKAVKLFGQKWKEVSEAWLRGESVGHWSIDGKDPNTELAPLLLSRAQFLVDLGNNDEYWSTVVPPGEK